MKKRAAIFNSKGLSLLEVMIAVFLLGIVAIPLLSLFAYNAALLRVSYNKTVSTYDAKSITERLYPLGYLDLFKAGTGSSPALDSASGKYYTIDISPSGPGGVVSGTACYMHLIVNGGGSGAFAGPDGKLESGSLPAVSAASLMDLRLSAPEAGTAYSLTNGSGAVIASGTKPAGTKAVLIVNCRYDGAEIGVTVAAGTSAAVLVYTPASFPADHLNVHNTAFSQLYRNDTPPASMLVSAVVKTYRDPSPGSQESVYQDTMNAGNLP